MSFAAPTMLLALLVVPLAVAGYLALSARRARRQAELGTMGLLQTRTGKPLGRRRHVPAAIFLVGLTVMLVGLAKPETTVELPRREGTVILAFDVSSSMVADDIKPTRIAAARAAGRAFVKRQPSSIQIGVVAFSDTGYLVQPPTNAKAEVLRSIRRLTPGGATSLGQAILTSLGAIVGKPLTLDPQALEDGAPQPNLPFLGSSAVILLTDGENTAQLDPVALADVAAQAGVRIHTVGLGSAEGAVIEIDGFSVATALDEELLKAIAEASNGKYFRAQDRSSLTAIYETIQLQLKVKGEKQEVTGIFAGAGLLLIVIAGALSMRWFGRVV